MTLELKGFFRYFPFIALPLLFFIGLFGTIDAFKNGKTFIIVFMLLWMTLLFYQTHRFSKMVVKIDLLDDGLITLKTITGKEYKLSPKDFISIKVKSSVIDFATKNGSFISLGNFDGFSDFIVTIKKANSDLVTKGC